MGCGASVPKEASPEQKATMCAVAGKEMMVICTPLALAKSDQIKVKAPPDVEKLRKVVSDLRAAAKDAKNLGTDEKVKEPEKKSGGGMLGGMMQAAADLGAQVVEAGVNAAGNVAAVAIEKSLNMAADQLEKAVNAVEKPFTEVGKEVAGEKKEQMQKVFENYIANLPLQSSGQAIKLVRGEDPQNDAAYRAVPGSALSDYLCRKSAKNLVQQLLPVCEEAIKKHQITNTWNSVIENFNSLCDTIKNMDFAKKNDLELKPIELDINDYIVSQCVEELAKIMGAEETAIRQTGTHKDAKRPMLFSSVFSGAQLTENLFKDMDKGMAA